MLILAQMWSKWASAETIKAAGKRVGISENGVNVGDMQEDKFIQAEGCISLDNSVSSTHSTPGCSQTISSPVYLRKGSALYYKHKFEQSQEIIKKCHEEALRLEDIPGLLTVSKVKPKQLCKSSTRVTQVHGSMEGHDIIDQVKVLNDEKERKKEVVKQKEDKKDEDKESFFRCKQKCVCDKQKCLAFGLRECPSCHSILKSICSKIICQVDGKKPTMILPHCSQDIKSKRSLKNAFNNMSESEDSEDDRFSVDNEVIDDDLESDDEEDAETILKSTWISLSPPVSEDDLIGKWYGCIYGDKKPQLYVAKVEKRFLLDEGGPVETILMRCLMPKTGSGITLQDTPKHLPPDITQFPLENIIFGLLEVIPRIQDSRSFNVPKYQELKDHFNIVAKLDRKLILPM